MYGIFPNVPVPYTFLEFLSAYYLYFLVFLLLVFVLYRVMKYRRKIKKEKYIEPLLPPYTWATQEINKLAAAGYTFSSRKESKLFYARLTEILRVYFERVFDISVMESTSEEFLIHMRETPFLSKDLFDKMKDFISRADLIKFAKQPTNAFESETDLKVVHFFIDKMHQETEFQSSENQESKETLTEK